VQEIQIIMSDDLVFTETGQRVPAVVTRRIALDGQEAEVDLTREHDEELAGLLDRYFRAGRAPDRGSPPAAAGPDPGPGGPGTHRFTPGVISRNRRIRAFAQERDLRSRKHPELPAYETPGGRWYYPAWLKEMYAEYEAGQQAAAGARVPGGAASAADSGMLVSS
jgi:hypothetical protein